MMEWKIQEWKMQEQIAGVENAGAKIAGVDKVWKAVRRNYSQVSVNWGGVYRPIVIDRISWDSCCVLRSVSRAPFPRWWIIAPIFAVSLGCLCLTQSFGVISWIRYCKFWFQGTDTSPLSYGAKHILNWTVKAWLTNVSDRQTYRCRTSLGCAAKIWTADGRGRGGCARSGRSMVATSMKMKNKLRTTVTAMPLSRMVNPKHVLCVDVIVVFYADDSLHSLQLKNACFLHWIVREKYRYLFVPGTYMPTVDCYACETYQSFGFLW